MSAPMPTPPPVPTTDLKTKKCRSPWLARRYAKKMLAQGWELAGPITRSGFVNKRYMVTITRTR